MKTALGRGIEALLPEKAEEVIKLDIDRIIPGDHQPRKVFRDESLNELAESIKEKGIIQPVIVTRQGDGTFKLIAGERRLRAAKLAGLKKIPAIIKDLASRDALEIALIENIQREDLDPIETALAFERLKKDFHLTQEEIAKKVGKDRASVANYLRLLVLPEEIKERLHEGSLSFGHAKAILGIEDRSLQVEVARKIIKEGLTVRQTEELVKKLSSREHKQSKKKVLKDPSISTLEERLKKTLGTPVRIIHRGKRGRIEITYNSLEEFDRLLDLLSGS
ncbi:MAG: ParB/RepB/Spo0J family partition protein [Thermodesulfovibrionales bacterium]|nr:ParB/RepB/Spo0J family partition protein [Thermodesulfovibrionales bacterium]